MNLIKLKFCDDLFYELLRAAVNFQIFFQPYRSPDQSSLTLE